MCGSRSHRAIRIHHSRHRTSTVWLRVVGMNSSLRKLFMEVYLVEALRVCRLSPDSDQFELKVLSRFVDEKLDDPNILLMAETPVTLAGSLSTPASALPVPKERRRIKTTPAV